jgi:hypothetical protein
VNLASVGATLGLPQRLSYATAKTGVDGGITIDGTFHQEPAPRRSEPGPGRRCCFLTQPGTVPPT